MGVTVGTTFSWAAILFSVSVLKYDWAYTWPRIADTPPLRWPCPLGYVVQSSGEFCSLLWYQKYPASVALHSAPVSFLEALIDGSCTYFCCCYSCSLVAAALHSAPWQPSVSFWRLWLVALGLSFAVVTLILLAPQLPHLVLYLLRSAMKLVLGQEFPTLLYGGFCPLEHAVQSGDEFCLLWGVIRSWLHCMLLLGGILSLPFTFAAVPLSLLTPQLPHLVLYLPWLHTILLFGGTLLLGDCEWQHSHPLLLFSSLQLLSFMLASPPFLNPTCWHSLRAVAASLCPRSCSYLLLWTVSVWLICWLMSRQEVLSHWSATSVAAICLRPVGVGRFRWVPCQPPNQFDVFDRMPLWPNKQMVGGGFAQGPDVHVADILGGQPVILLGEGDIALPLPGCLVLQHLHHPTCACPHYLLCTCKLRQCGIGNCSCSLPRVEHQTSHYSRHILLQFSFTDLPTSSCPVKDLIQFLL